MQELQYFVRKGLPSLMHLQIAEALQTVLGSVDALQPVILDFENKKLKEIVDFETVLEGK